MENDEEVNIDLIAKLRGFLSGATKSSKSCDLELTRIALSLLGTIPASRDAILEYFCTVFDITVRKYASKAKNDQLMNSPVPLSQQEEDVMTEIHSVLCSFVTSSPQAWAPIISTWSLQLLGRLSSRYSSVSSSCGLNEILHWWMSCKAARTLVDITTQCLHRLIDTDAEACVSALLDTSVAYSPHFDWVVALVGSCFSKTVITRILSLGLKDFSNKANAGSSKSSKLKSVVGILGHLGAGHFTDIRSALLELFLWGQQSNGNDAVQKNAVVPYLLQLANHSQTLLNALTADVLHKLNMETVLKMGNVGSSWSSYLDGDENQLETLVVSLILRCERGGSKIISLLLDGTSVENQSVALTCQVLIELLLEELTQSVRSDKTSAVPFLASIKTEIKQLTPLLLTETPLRQTALCRLLRILENENQSVAIEATNYLLQNGSSAIHMATLMMLIEPHEGGCPNLLAAALEQVLRQSPSSALWRNLCALLRHAKSTGNSPDGVVAKAATQNLSTLCLPLTSNKVLQSERGTDVNVVGIPTSHGQDCDLAKESSVMEVLELLPTECLTSLPLQLCLRIISNVVLYFFSSMQLKDESKKSTECKRICVVIERLCNVSGGARAAALRDLLESALFLSHAAMFGSSRRHIYRIVDTPYCLTDENYKLRVRTNLSGRQSRAFANGVILDAGSTKTSLSQTEIKTNMHHFIDIIKSCCRIPLQSTPGAQMVSLDASIQVALLLVELISPDVMYNGLPWPEEDFCKVTIERDIHIRKVFDEVPVAWHLLEFLARQQPALCYCSVLLRALMASLISQWSSPSTSSKPSVLDTTVRLLRLMCIGQLLPPPLNNLQYVIPHVTPPEALTMIRGCVWNYMRDNVPSPALFSPDPRSGFMWRDPTSIRPSPCYIEPMRLVVFNNISQFAKLYSNLFVRS